VTHTLARSCHEEGATAVEYGIMVALIAVVIVAAVLGLGQQLKGDYKCVEDHINAPQNAPIPC
jgi:pilus assembly protein Flp/PilA